MPDRASSARRLTLALGLHQLLAWATSFYLPAIVMGAAARDLGTAPEPLLAAFSGALLVAGGCAPAIGGWIGRAGGRRPMACGALLLASGLALLAASSGLAVWWLGWAVLGSGMALSLYDAAFATAGVALGTGTAPAITGIALIGGFASTVGWPLGSLLLPELGWRGLLLLYAGLHLVGGLPLILLAVPRSPARHGAPVGATVAGRRRDGAQLACLGAFFATRWFITSAIAAHILVLTTGLGLSGSQAVVAAMLIGPGQVAGRLLDWLANPVLSPLSRARVGAVLFPAGALLLLSGVPGAGFGFMVLYGMSNGILTINRGTLPILVLGPQGYANRLGRLALPTMVAQAAAPTLTASLVAATTASGALLLAGAVAAAAALLLVPLRPFHGDESR